MPVGDEGAKLPDGPLPAVAGNVVRSRCRWLGSVHLANIPASSARVASERSNAKAGSSLAAIGGGVYTSVVGQPWAGGFIGTAGVVGLVSVFVLGRRR